jgi:hypothetical protein
MPPPRAAVSADPAPRLFEHALSPAALDPAVDAYRDDGFALRDTRVPGADLLVVYLVGAGGKPKGSLPMLRVLASFGLHVVAPHYANDYGISKCDAGTEPDDDCHRRIRLEAFEGVDHSRHIVISRRSSIEGRVVRMLDHLGTADPGGDWARFANGPAGPRWDRIIVAGHSHGASTAGLVGAIRRVHRVVMLSGPFDNRAGTPAPWTSSRPLTTRSRFYAFSHTHESQHAGHLAVWAAMGLPALGPVVDVALASPPYGASHQLVTSLPVAPHDSAHASTSAGGDTPQLPDGSHRYLPVWRYLFGR